MKKKIISLTLAALMLISAVPTSFAADVDVSQGTVIKVVGAGTGSYTITVPAKLNPGQSGTVKAEGTWPSTQTLNVTAPNFVTLTHGEQSLNVDVTFPGIHQAGNDTEALLATETVAIGDASVLFGKWTGHLYYNVDMTEESVTPEEGYVGTVSSDNTITLSGMQPGTYRLNYANADGALADFEEICTLTVTDPDSPVSYTGLIPENCAPLNSTRIDVFNENGEKVGELPLGGLAVTMGTRQYSFGAISDVHIGYNTSEEDFARALDYFSNNTTASFVGISGDLTAEATDAQYQLYKSIVDQHAKIPVYEITGNHDTEAYRGSNVSSFIETYIGNPIYYSFEHGNDVFIMLGIENEEVGSMFAEGEMQWFYETLEANRNKRCFVFTHAYPPDSSGDPSDMYGFDLWGHDEEDILLELLAHYPNVTMFHGHSHIEFMIQNKADETNVETTKGYNSIHVPSITVPRSGELVSGSVMFEYLTEESEGYLVEVYNDGIILKGRDFVGEKFLPIAHYRVNTPISTVAAGTYEDSTGELDVSAAYDTTVTISGDNANSTYPYAKVMSGTAFNTTIVGDWGYAVDSIQVTMGGTDITDSVVNDNQVSISNVTGNIVITVETHFVSDNIIDVVGYLDNVRFSGSSGAEKEEQGHVGSGYIYVGDFVEGDTITISGVDFRELEYPDCGVYVGLDKDKNVITGGYFNESQIRQFSYTLHEDGSVTLVCDDLSNRPITYLRVSGMGLGANLVITKN